MLAYEGHKMSAKVKGRPIKSLLNVLYGGPTKLTRRYAVRK